LSIGLFKRPYTVRKHGKQVIEKGYPSAPYTDVTARLDVQPLAPNELMALPEGERTVKRIKSFGPDKLASADNQAGVPGDRLFYRGEWYECKSSVRWDHTMLSHYRSDFALINEQPEPPGEAADP
jgi:hypothetical protein